MSDSLHRFRFAARYALGHGLVSMAVALLSAAWVFGLLYPWPYHSLLGAGKVFLLLLVVDGVCGPLLTLMLASPTKSRRERWLDLGLVGVIQVVALVYGLHSLWVARPVVLAFERDRLVAVTANEVDVAMLPKVIAALPALRTLPWWGVAPVATRHPADSNEYFQSVDLGLAGISPAMRPDWWLPWSSANSEMAQRAKPLSHLLERMPQATDAVLAAARNAKMNPQQLSYLPLTSSKTRDWIALLNEQLEPVGYVPVDGF